MSAIDLWPRALRGPAVCRVLAALDRGETLLVPAHLSLMLGSVAGQLAFVARLVGAPVIVCDAVDEITTRERVDA